MASALWSLVTFVGGGCAGILLMALMRMTGDLPEQLDDCPRGWIGNDPIRPPGSKETFCSFRCRDSFVNANHPFQANIKERQFESQRRLPRQVDRSEVEFLAATTCWRNSAGGRLPRYLSKTSSR